MHNWKTHTPEGTLDILEKDCFAKRAVEQTIKDIFLGHGYCEVQTPTFEFYDVFADESGDVDQSSMMKFLDKKGRIMVLRPDITTPIARVAATKLQSEVMPKRMSYIGSAFRDGDSHAGAVQKEFTQAGVELIGINSPEADAEIIAITIKALLKAGLNEFQIDIGQAQFFKGIMEQTNLDEDAIEKMRVLIDRKSFVGVYELAQEYSIKDDLKELIFELPNLFGGIEVIEKLSNMQLGERAKAALANLTEIYNILSDYGFEKYVSFDLGMVQGLNYYTGVIIKGYARGVGFPLCGGGRYDNLIGEFGKNMPATGIAIGIERLISALNSSGAEFEAPSVHTLICYDKARSTAFKVADGLRSSGLCVEMWVGGENPEEYAKQKGIGGIVRVIDDETLDIINIQDSETTRTSIFDLLGGVND